MKVIHQTLLNMLKEHREICLAANGVRPLPEKADELSFAVLLLAAEYAAECRGNTSIINSIHESIAAIASKGTLLPDSFFPPESWVLTDQFALMMAEALIGRDQTPKGTPLPFYLLKNPKSDIRLFCFKSIWFFREHCKEYVMEYLLKNIADTLGYVEECIGLARSLFRKDEEFFSIADSFEPESYEDQYRNRIAQLKENPVKLASYVNLFLPLEIRIRKLIGEYTMSMELISADSETGQLKLLH